MRKKPSSPQLVPHEFLQIQQLSAQEEATWIRVLAFGKLAETAGEHLRKGDRVYVEGKLQVRSYTGKDGKEKVAVELLANELVMLSSTKKPAAVGADDDLPF
jgi:single-strand DNA-binding protein